MSIKGLHLPPLVFAGEEKLQHWQPVSLGYAPVSYAITHGPRKERVDQVEWPRGLFQCFSAPTAGVNCFFANCCCCTQYFLWQEAYEIIGLGSEAGAVATMRLFAAALPQGGEHGGGGLGGAANLVGSYNATRLRGRLSNQLYGRNADGGTFGTAFAQCCCMQLAMAQEIDAIITSVEDRTGKKLLYGTFCTPRCCNFVNAAGKTVTSYDLSVGVRGPQGQVMQRGWAPTNLMGLPPTALTQQLDREDFHRQLDRWARKNARVAPA